MVNRYTADRRLRHNDSYTPGGEGGQRPDRAVIVYAQRCREAFRDVPIVLGGIEASLRRIAHYDYWSDKVRRSVLVDAKADLLLYGNAERAMVEIAHRAGRGRASPRPSRDIRGTCRLLQTPRCRERLDRARHADESSTTAATEEAPRIEDASTLRSADMPCDPAVVPPARLRAGARASRECSMPRPPACCTWKAIPAMPAPWCSATATSELWLDPPPIPLTTAEMDGVYDLPYARAPHPVLWRGQDPRLGHDPLFGQHHARLLRRLHLLLDHRA